MSPGPPPRIPEGSATPSPTRTAQGPTRPFLAITKLRGGRGGAGVYLQREWKLLEVVATVTSSSLCNAASSCAVVWPAGGGPRLRCVAGTLCGQPADGPRRACPSVHVHAACLRSRWASHTRGFMACNSERVWCASPRFAQGEGKTAPPRPAPGLTLGSVGSSVCARGGGGLPRDSHH